MMIPGRSRIIFFIFLAGCLLIITANIFSQTSRILGNDSPDAEKIVIAVIGDGYDASDIESGRFAGDVQRLVVEGLFEDDFFRDYKDAFNVYRVDAKSNVSGVSLPGQLKDTALGVIFYGKWEKCWLGAPNLTEANLKQKIGSLNYDYVIIIANHDDSRGGCHPGGNRLFITKSVNTSVLTHEYGHAFANLLDEYTVSAPPPNPLSVGFNARNCSRLLDKNRVVWKEDLTPNVVLPTVSFPTGFDAGTTVGMFKGCNYEKTGVYRPMQDCRMLSAHDPFVPFCKVCRKILSKSLQDLKEKKKPPHPVQKEFLSIKVQISADGTSIVNVNRFTSELASSPILNTFSNYLFEFKSGQKIIAAAFLPEDPFTVRAFPDPENDRGEILPPASTVNFSIKVPLNELPDETLNNLSVQFYQLKSDDLKIEQILTGTEPSQLLQKLNELKQNNLLNKKDLIQPNDFKTIQFSNKISSPIMIR